MTRVLLLGCDGQVGSDLQKWIPSSYQLFTSSKKTSDKANHLQLDLTDELRLRHALRDIRPGIVINAAAYTAVDKAENEKDLAMAINHQALAIMAEELSLINSFLIHYSTDYVYAGVGNYFRSETEDPAPLNFYGLSKYQGEKALRKSSLRHVVFRTSWVFSEHGHNFVKTMLKLGAEHEELKIVSDQIGAPTSARLLAKVTAKTMVLQLSEANDLPRQLYHICCDGTTSWYEFAQEIFTQARNLGLALKVQRLVPISTKEFPTPAIRPLNSRLDCSRIKRDLGISVEHWKEELSRVLQVLAGENWR
ncbi:MAG: dTDP-4-dehydrorhamnose reductase [Oligoflexus sp.]